MNKLYKESKMFMWILALLALVAAWFSYFRGFTPMLCAALAFCSIEQCELQYMIRDKKMNQHGFGAAWKDSLVLTLNFIALLWAFEPLVQKLIAIVAVTILAYYLAWWQYSRTHEADEDLKEAEESLSGSEAA